MAPIVCLVCFAETTDADKQWFNARVCKLLGENLGIRWEVDDVFVKQNIMWGDFLKPGADPRNYEEARDPKAMLKLMDDYLGMGAVCVCTQRF